MKTTLKTLALAAVLLPGIASVEMSQEEIAKASQNPLTPDDYGEKWQMRIQVQLLFPR